MRRPTSLYRIQFHRGFTLRDALPLLDYWSRLGISHLYASPLTLAVPGSLHGYDVLDYGQIDPDRGNEEDLEALVNGLREREMGLVLDIVPNHMAISHPGNRWWWDVLEKGPGSAYAGYFDIDWEGGKVVLPCLARPLEEAVERGELRLVEEGGRPLVASFERRFPLKSEPKGRELLALLAEQHYELCYWREGSRRINYRRFFDIYDLAGLRVEERRVFDDVHRLVLEWVGRGWIDGLRIDHVDGMADPTQYLIDLRKAAPHALLWVEKILVGKERLPEQWPVEGTTGYDYLNSVGGLFVDSGNRELFEAIYREFTGIQEGPLEVVVEAKREVLERSFISEVERLSAPGKEVVQAVAAAFPVYRTYFRPGEETAEDRPHLEAAIETAKRLRPSLASALDGFLELFSERGDFVRRFQQLTGPVMAKGVEDTAFYRYFPLASVNEVGGEVGDFGVTVEEFHKQNRERLERFPHTLLTTSTHDTKRSGDVRMRIHALSEIPEEWSAALLRWHSEASGWGIDLDPNTEYLLYQTMVGAWPHGYEPDFRERLIAYMEKAGKEGKVQTSWTDPNPEYWERLEAFIGRCLDPACPFREDFIRLADRVAKAGRMNGLSQLVLKLASPGIPEFYQGTELYQLTLVDPDNRRPVDYEGRVWALGEVEERLPADCPDPIQKLAVIRAGLHLRRALPELFWRGRYLPLEVRGEGARHVMAFAREWEGRCVVAAVSRFSLQFTGWGETTVVLPPEVAGRYHDTLSRQEFEGLELSAEALFSRMPVALLERGSSS
ncbi:MAG: malto-oligosyltrehalose synthase [Parachlamydiales bacterium]